jgi:hypothetical protein
MMNKKLDLGMVPFVAGIIAALAGAFAPIRFLEAIWPSDNVTIGYMQIATVLVIFLVGILQEISLVGSKKEMRIIIYLTEIILYLIIPSKLLFWSALLFVVSITTIKRTLPTESEEEKTETKETEE